MHGCPLASHIRPKVLSDTARPQQHIYKACQPHLQIHCLNLRLPAALAARSSSCSKDPAEAPADAAAGRLPLLLILLLPVPLLEVRRSRVMRALSSSTRGCPAEADQTAVSGFQPFNMFQASIIPCCADTAKSGPSNSDQQRHLANPGKMRYVVRNVANILKETCTTLPICQL